MPNTLSSRQEPNNCRPPIRIEQQKTLKRRQLIGIEHEKKPLNFVSQSESSITSSESSANQNLGSGGGLSSALGSSRLAIAYLNT